MAGALIQWLRDELGIIDSVAETDAIARSVATTDGVFVVPAFTGLGAPWWDADARGAILGLTRGAGRAHIVRAALESIAYQVCDLARAMAEDARMPLSVLNVDGGAAANDFLMQFQADMLGAPLRRPDNAETTALGARLPGRSFHGLLEKHRGAGGPARRRRPLPAHLRRADARRPPRRLARGRLPRPQLGLRPSLPIWCGKRERGGAGALERLQ